MDPVLAAHRAYLCGNDGRFTPTALGRLVEPVPAAPGIGARILARKQHEAAELVGERFDPRSGRDILGRLPAPVEEDDQRRAAPSAVAART
jgi:hypothetical protein